MQMTCLENHKSLIFRHFLLDIVVCLGILTSYLFRVWCVSANPASKEQLLNRSCRTVNCNMDVWVQAVATFFCFNCSKAFDVAWNIGSNTSWLPGAARRCIYPVANSQWLCLTHAYKQWWRQIMCTQPGGHGAAAHLLMGGWHGDD